MVRSIEVKNLLVAALALAVLMMWGCGGAFTTLDLPPAGDGGPMPDSEVGTKVVTSDAGDAGPMEDAGERDAISEPSSGSGSGSSSGSASGSSSGSASGASSGSSSSGTSSGASSGSGSDCSAGATRCVGHQPQACVSGSWQANGLACLGAAPVCLDGACVECTPGSRSCAGATQPQTCDSTGFWVQDTACSGATPLCSAGACAGICCKFSLASGPMVQACDAASPWTCAGAQTYACTGAGGQCALGSTCNASGGPYGGVVEACQ